MIRVPLSMHTVTPRSVNVESKGPGVILHAGATHYLTPGEARYLAEALIDAAGRVEDAAS